ncbi:MAG: hypothetical protein ABW019_07335 [Chitinophagaceae bacterium]
MVQHTEFFDSDHFENNYHRIPPPAGLSALIDFFWETRFDQLWASHPKGFSDAQFANIGYTYIINLGTPCVMQVGDKKTGMKADAFLPRYNPIECFHKPGNHLFGIKFRISPVVVKKKVNFSEYRGYIYPLSYLLEPAVIAQVKEAGAFEDRISILSNYFFSELAGAGQALHPVEIVSDILDQCFQHNRFTIPVEELAGHYGLSTRTLQRYFEICTGVSSKQALQVMRIRKATAHLVHSPGNFDSALYGYYDHSHFYKHLKQFVQGCRFRHRQPHLALLALLHKV